MKKIIVALLILAFYSFEAWNDYTWDKRYLNKLSSDDWIVFDLQNNAIDPIYVYQFIKRPNHRLGLIQKSSIIQLAPHTFQYNMRWVDRGWNKALTVEDFLSFAECSQGLSGNLKDKTSEISISNIEWEKYADNKYVTSEEDKKILAENFNRRCKILEE